jgi:hypothetical protein
MIRRLIFVGTVALLALQTVPVAEAQGTPLPKPNAYKFIFWEECIPGCPDMCECTINGPIIIS